MTHQSKIQDGSTVLRISKEAGGLSSLRGSGTSEAYLAARHRLGPVPTDVRESLGAGGAAPHRLCRRRHSLWKAAVVRTPWRSAVLCAAPNSPVASCQPSGIRYTGFFVLFSF